MKDTLENRNSFSKSLLVGKIRQFIDRAEHMCEWETFELLGKDAQEIADAALRLDELNFVRWQGTTRNEVGKDVNN